MRKVISELRALASVFAFDSNDPDHNKPPHCEWYRSPGWPSRPYNRASGLLVSKLDYRRSCATLRLPRFTDGGHVGMTFQHGPQGSPQNTHPSAVHNTD